MIVRWSVSEQGWVPGTGLPSTFSFGKTIDIVTAVVQMPTIDFMGHKVIDFGNPKFFKREYTDPIFSLLPNLL
jgi:hypothetical protein